MDEFKNICLFQKNPPQSPEQLVKHYSPPLHNGLTSDLLRIIGS